MNARSIAQLATLFAALFAILVLRQLYVQVVRGPSIAARPYNPRHALLDRNRGRIMASDGTVLAHTVGGKRAYPFGPALAHAVGYVSQRYGTAGLEDAYDSALTAPDTTGDFGAQAGQIGAALGGANAEPHGADIVTTLQMPVQLALYQQLARHARGAGIVFDPRTGAVLAMASVPSFDPNTVDTSFAALSKAPDSPLIDRATDGLYPPGSTFKIVTAAIALDAGVVTMDSQWDDAGYFQIGNYIVHDDEGEVPGLLDLTGAFAKSSNVDFAQIALKIGTDTWFQYAQRWGFGDSFDFQLPAQRDRIPPRAEVYPGILAQMGFGQASLLVSPMRMGLVASTIANGGIEQRPYIVRSIRTGAAASDFGPAQLAAPVSPETAQNVKNMMVAVVQSGTGTSAALPNVTVAGKTGTATNPAGRAHSWFVCFAPAQAPRIAVAIVVENAGYGAAVAAPIAKQVLRVALQTVKS